MITIRVVKRLKNIIVYDEVKRPWYSPWKVERKRWTVSPEGFDAICGGKTVEGESITEEGEGQ